MSKSIYVGPHNKAIGIHQYEIFDDGFPPHVEHALTSNPALGNFFMPFTEFVNRTPPGSGSGIKVMPGAPVKLGPQIKNRAGKIS